MANNRVYLGHPELEMKIYLGKRMAWGWYGVPDDLPEKLRLLFEAGEHSGLINDSQDNFVLLLEDPERTTALPDNDHQDWDLL